MKRRRLPSPAMMVALLALFVALSGTAVAAGIVPRAKVALNALKLQGKTAAQVAAQDPAPSTRLTVKTGSWSLGPGGVSDFSVACDAGAKATGGGFDGPAVGFQSRPSSDGGAWRVLLANLSDTASSSGTLYVICLA